VIKEQQTSIGRKSVSDSENKELRKQKKTKVNLLHQPKKRPIRNVPQ
jgi:hypothetical protein